MTETPTLESAGPSRASRKSSLTSPETLARIYGSLNEGRVKTPPTLSKSPDAKPLASRRKSSGKGPKVRRYSSDKTLPMLKSPPIRQCSPDDGRRSFSPQHSRYRPVYDESIDVEETEVLNPIKRDEIKSKYRPAKPSDVQPKPPSSSPTKLNPRFRRLKVSIEDRVQQQQTIDVLYNDRMPRPVLNRHNYTVPRTSAG